MPIAKLSSKNQIVLPKESRTKMKIRAGDKLIIETINGITTIIPKPKSITASLKGAAKGLYPPNYIRHERESW